MSHAAAPRTKRVKIPPDDPCPCGSGRRIADCCQPAATGAAAVVRLAGGIFLAFHAVAIPLATVAGWFQPDSLAVSGVVLAPTGLVIAAISFRARRPIGFCYGLAAPTAAVVGFALICGVYQGADSARMVVGLLLALFALVCVPLGVRR